MPSRSPPRATLAPVGNHSMGRRARRLDRARSLAQSPSCGSTDPVWTTKLGRNDVDDTVFWQQTPSTGGGPTATRPKLVWPGDPNDKTLKGIREGLNHLASG